MQGHLRMRTLNQFIPSIVPARGRDSACFARELLPAGTEPVPQGVETARIVEGPPPLYSFERAPYPLTRREVPLKLTLILIVRGIYKRNRATARMMTLASLGLAAFLCQTAYGQCKTE